MKTLNNKTNLKTKTFREVLKNASVSDTFNAAYTEELLRLSLASEIRTVRMRKRLTQEDLAQKVNMPQSVIARIESGTHTFSLATLDKIAHVLGKKVKLA